MMKHKGILVVISGFSGAGKGTMVKKLLEEHKNYSLSISMTTRNPRDGEENGKDYFFVSHDEFEETIKKDGLIEYASYCDNYYGTPREYIEKELEKGVDIILEIEQQGAFNIKKKFPDTLLIFVTAPSAKELVSRLEGRGTETKEVITKRLVRAGEEAEGIEKYDFILVNDELEKAVEELHMLIQLSKNKPECNNEFIEEIRADLSAYLKEGGN